MSKTRLLTAMAKLRDAALAFPDILYYVDEAIFLKKTRSNGLDKRLLSARIRHKAHVMEQDIYIVGKPRFKFFKNELESLLNLWKTEFPEDDDPTVCWSMKILESYKKRFGE